MWTPRRAVFSFMHSAVIVAALGHVLPQNSTLTSPAAHAACASRLTQPTTTWLNGAHLTLGEVQWAPYAIFNASAPKGWSGFDIDLINLVAARLNFTYDIVNLERGPTTCPSESCFLGDDVPPLESWDDVLRRGSIETDLILSWWTDSSARREFLGMLTGHIDDSAIMVVRTELDTWTWNILGPEFWTAVSEKSLAFLRPFTYSLWLTIIAMICIGGFADYLLEREEGGRIGNSLCASRRRSSLTPPPPPFDRSPSFRSTPVTDESFAGAFFGGYDQPRTRLSAAYQICLSFCMLVVIASCVKLGVSHLATTILPPSSVLCMSIMDRVAPLRRYTANLAAAILSEGRDRVTAESMHQVRCGLPILNTSCLRARTTHGIWIEARLMHISSSTSA